MLTEKMQSNLLDKFSFNFLKQNISYDQENLVKQAQLFLDTNNVEAYTNMLMSGYQPTKQQTEFMSVFIDNLVESNDYFFDDDDIFVQYNRNYIKIEKFLQQGIQLSYQNIFNILKNNSFYVKQFDKLGKYYSHIKQSDMNYKNAIMPSHLNSRFDEFSVQFPIFINQINQAVNDPLFSNYLSALFMKSLMKSNTFKSKTKHYEKVLEQFYYILIFAPNLLFKNVAFKDFLMLTKKLNKYKLEENTQNTLNFIVNHFYSNNVQEVLNTTKIHYSENLVNTLTVNNIKKEQYDIKDLPLKASAILLSIEQLYKKIDIDKKLNTTIYNEKLELLNMLLEKRIPEILSKYLTIDPSYRTTLVSSQGKNAEQLMIESLENIKQSFHKVFEEMNQSNVNDLSVSNRYTQALNN